MQKGAKANPRILLTIWQPETLEPCSGFDISAMRVRAPFGPSRVRALVAFFLTLPTALRRLRRLVRTNNITVINPHFPGLECFLFVLARMVLGVKLVLSLHGTELLDMLKSRGIERWWFQRLLSGSDYIVVPSHAVGRRLRTFAPAAEERIRVIWNGTDPEEFRNLASASTIALPEQPYVLMVGGFDLLKDDTGASPPRFRKGYDVLFQAWPAIAARNPEVRLVIAGSSGRSVEWIREQTARAARVTLLERLPDAAVARLMSAATMLLLPSRGAESFGIVLIEAGAHGVPVVATTVDGIPEVVRDGVDGFLVRPEDPAVLAAAVNRLLADPALAHRMGQNFRARVAVEFTWTRAAKQYEDLATAPRLQDTTISGKGAFSRSPNPS